MNTKVFNSLINEDKIWTAVQKEYSVDVLNDLKKIKKNYLKYYKKYPELKPEYLFQPLKIIRTSKKNNLLIVLQGINDVSEIVCWGSLSGPRMLSTYKLDYFIQAQKNRDIIFEDLK